MGGAFQFFCEEKSVLNKLKPAPKTRSLVYQIVTCYLLFKIGFSGGKSMVTESLDYVFFTSFVAVSASIMWTVMLIKSFSRWTRLDGVTQTSIATHFGSVSVGTFIAGLAFLEALQIPASDSVVVWLALMELPAIFVGASALGVGLKSVLNIAKRDISLIILVVAIFLGAFLADYFPKDWYAFLFGLIFTPILTYFLFEMGRKAYASFHGIKSNLSQLISIGTIVPLLGGVFGASLGFLFDYSEGEMFVFSILMASASYVLVPISMREILKSVYGSQKTEKAISTSMAISVGITLPFNIIIGFEVYHLFIDVLLKHPILALVGGTIPFIVYLASIFSVKK